MTSSSRNEGYSSSQCVIIRASPCWNAFQTTKLSADVKHVGKNVKTHLLASRKTFQICYAYLAGMEEEVLLCFFCCFFFYKKGSINNEK